LSSKKNRRFRFYHLSLITAAFFLSLSPLCWGETSPRISNNLAQTLTIDRKTEADRLVQQGLKQLENNQTDAKSKLYPSSRSFRLRNRPWWAKR